jgi:hypothetical protein
MNAEARAIANPLWGSRWKSSAQRTTSEYDGNTAFGAYRGGNRGGSISLLAMAAFGGIEKDVWA